MKSAGCKAIFFGIESASPKVLKLIRKDVDIDHAKEIVKLTEKIGIRTHCSFIIGLPGETIESLNEINNFIDDTKPTGRILPNILDILPGTELYEKKRLYFKEWPSIPYADVSKFQLEILYNFFERTSGLDGLFRVMPPNIVIT
jgi:radical SAM superfamily enzyme YgiQ (UPF0313 family)